MQAANYAPIYAACLYPELEEMFRTKGWALAVHGSLARDFDIVAIPWHPDCYRMFLGRPKHEFERQMSIAQTAINWMVQMGIDVYTTRAAEVVAAGGVNEWARRYMPN